MSRRLRYLALIAGRTRAPLAPLALTLVTLLGTYAYARNEPGSTYGLTALACTALAAWLVGAVLAGERSAQSEMATAALGGRRALDALLVAITALALTALFVAYPLILQATAVADAFAPHARAADVAAAVLAHAAASTLGGAIGVLFAPPRVTRRATATAATTAALLLLIAVSRPLGPLGGPAALAQQLSDARPGTLRAGELAAALSCLALSAAAFGAATHWE